MELKVPNKAYALSFIFYAIFRYFVDRVHGPSYVLLMNRVKRSGTRLLCCRLCLDLVMVLLFVNPFRTAVPFWGHTT